MLTDIKATTQSLKKKTQPYKGNMVLFSLCAGRLWERGLENVNYKTMLLIFFMNG